MMFIKYAAFHLQQVGLKKQKAEKDVKTEESDESADGKSVEKGSEEQQLNSDEAKKIVEGITDSITHGEKPDVEESTKVSSKTIENLTKMMHSVFV